MFRILTDFEKHPAANATGRFRLKYLVTKHVKRKLQTTRGIVWFDDVEEHEAVETVHYRNEAEASAMENRFANMLGKSLEV